MNFQGFEFLFSSNSDLIDVDFLHFLRLSPISMRFLFFRYTSPDFLYVRSWLPCIFFSGGVTVGNIGRQLAMVVSFSLIKSVRSSSKI